MLTYELTSDEALAHGAWESGVRLAAGYPGSPSTRFLEHLVEISDSQNVFAEWSANEKVAFEIALGASMAGKRAVVSFKSVGLNVAMDPLMVANLGGVVGGLVVVLGDDPGGYGSQNEQDGRILLQGAGVPLLEFSSPQEAYDMGKYAFSLSEKFELPVFIRETRSSSLEKGTVHVEGERIPSTSLRNFTSLAPWKRFPLRPPEKHGNLFAKSPEITALFNRSPFNQMVVNSPRGIIASGYMAAKAWRLFNGKERNGISFLKLGTVLPLPEEKLLEFLSRLESVLILEEVQPVIERQVRSLLQRHRLDIQVFGKETGHLPRTGELFTSHILKGIRGSLGMELSSSSSGVQEGFPEGAIYRSLPIQCPYYQAFHVFSQALPRDHEKRPIFVGDDGCLIRLMNPPFSLLDCKFCMGSAIGVATGLARSGVNRKIVAVVGDSAFFHTGVPAYLNAVASGAGIMILVLDNRSTAMTGCQANPGTDFDIRGKLQQRIDLASVLQSAGIRVFRSVDAFGEKSVLIQAFLECLESEALSVLLVTGPCPKTTGQFC